MDSCEKCDLGEVTPFLGMARVTSCWCDAIGYAGRSGMLPEPLVFCISSHSYVRHKAVGDVAPSMPVEREDYFTNPLYLKCGRVIHDSLGGRSPKLLIHW